MHLTIEKYKTKKSNKKMRKSPKHLVELLEVKRLRELCFKTRKKSDLVSTTGLVSWFGSRSQRCGTFSNHYLPFRTATHNKSDSSKVQKHLLLEIYRILN